MCKLLYAIAMLYYREERKRTNAENEQNNRERNNVGK